MAWSLPVPNQLKQHWKVKIRDKERLEPPHITVLRGTDVWRINLRTGQFEVPPGGVWSDLPDGLTSTIRDKWVLLCEQWDNMYPHNPVGETVRP